MTADRPLGVSNEPTTRSGIYQAAPELACTLSVPLVSHTTVSVASLSQKVRVDWVSTSCRVYGQVKYHYQETKLSAASPRCFVSLDYDYH